MEHEIPELLNPLPVEPKMADNPQIINLVIAITHCWISLNLVQSHIMSQPIHYKCLKSKNGQGHMVNETVQLTVAESNSGVWILTESSEIAVLCGRGTNLAKALTNVHKLSKHHLRNCWFCSFMGLVTRKYKKLISRWDSERELFTTTSYTYHEIQKEEKNKQLNSR